jgi:predicted  nucleic acid-binding Zn-ribbon protein
MLTPVGNVIQTINKEREQTEKTLDVLSKLREDAENAIPTLQTSLKQLTNTLSKDIVDVSGKLQKLDNEMTNELEKAIEVMGAHLGSLSEQLVKDYQPLVTSLRSLIELANRSKTSR